MTEFGPTSGQHPTGNLWRPSMTGVPGGRSLGPLTFFDFYINNIESPDWTWAKDPNFFEKVADHPKSGAAILKRSRTVATFPLTMIPSKAANVDKMLAQQVSDYAFDVFDNLPNFQETIRQVNQGGILFGGRGIEWIWAQDANGVSRPVETWDVHGSRILFDTDGNPSLLTTQAPVWGAYIGKEPQRINKEISAYMLPPGRFSYYKYMAEGGPWQRPVYEGFNYHGRGETMRLYMPVMYDYYMIKYEMTTADKHGTPHVSLFYPENMGVDVSSYVQQLERKTVSAFPRTANEDPRSLFDVQFQVPSGLSYNIFEQFHDRAGEWIDIILLGGADQMQLANVGGYNATEGQRDAGEVVVFAYDAMCLSKFFTNQIVPYIVRAVPKWANLPDEVLPKVSLMPQKLRNRLQELQLLQSGAQMVPIREADIYEAIGKTRPKDGLDGSEPEPAIFLGQPQNELFNGFPTPAGTDTGADVSSSVTQEETQIREAYAARTNAGNYVKGNSNPDEKGNNKKDDKKGEK